MTATATPTAAPDVAIAFLDAVATRDLDRLESLLHPDVWFRILLPRGAVDLHDVRAVVERFHEWYLTPSVVRLLDAEHHTMAGREHLRYRFALRPTWAPDTWHLIEQTGYARVAEGRIRRLDLVCTGFHPVADHAM
jgi:hypothetical protein